MKVYLDTSIVLRVLLRQRPTLKGWHKFEAFSSELMRVEVMRTMDRLRIQGVLDIDGCAAVMEEFRQIENRITVIDLNKPILRRACDPMPSPIATLDALHLATAILLRDNHAMDLHLATHDIVQSKCAQALGLPVIGM